MPTILTQIIEGPRPEDGRVRYHCPTCGNDTNWIEPPRPETGNVLHYCDSTAKAQAKRDNRQEPCATNYLNAAESNLRGALAKLHHAASRAEIEETLQKLRQWVREALNQELSERDKLDGLNNE